MCGDLEGPLEMLPDEKHKELRSGKDCNKWRKGYVIYAHFQSRQVRAATYNSTMRLAVWKGSSSACSPPLLPP